MNLSTHEYLLLNPDEQHPLYRSKGSLPHTKQDSLFTQGEQLRSKFPDYEEREREYQEWYRKRNEE